MPEQLVATLLLAAADDPSAVDHALEVAQVVLIAAGLAGIILAPFRIILRRPKVEIRPRVWKGGGAETWTFAAVEARNRPLPSWLSWLFTRETAYGCHISIEFLRGNQTVIEAFAGRWSDRPEPIRVDPLPDGTFRFVPALELLPGSRVFDLPPTWRWHEVAVAVLRTDGTAHAWGAESYFSPEWRRPDWELDQARYEIALDVTWADQRTKALFELKFTSTDFADFQVTRRT